ncbi:MAG: RhuM family protein, partial [Polycyclovorans sp.]
MTMKGWIAKLDEFLRISDHEILTHAGRISQDMAQSKAEAEFAKFQAQQAALESRVERDFEQAIQLLPKPGPKSRAAKKKPT